MVKWKISQQKNAAQKKQQIWKDQQAWERLKWKTECAPLINWTKRSKFKTEKNRKKKNKTKRNESRVLMKLRNATRRQYNDYKKQKANHEIIGFTFDYYHLKR